MGTIYFYYTQWFPQDIIAISSVVILPVKCFLFHVYIDVKRYRPLSFRLLGIMLNRDMHMTILPQVKDIVPKLTPTQTSLQDQSYGILIWYNPGNVFIFRNNL